MKKFKIITTIALCALVSVLFAGCDLVLGSAANNSNGNDMTYVIKENYDKVVSIECYFGGNTWTGGSGVLIYATDSYSLVATNAHVITYGTTTLPKAIYMINWSEALYNGELNTSNSVAMAPYTTEISNPTTTNGKILYYNLEEDLAIIKYTPPAAYKNKYVALRDGILTIGEPIAAMGYSLGEYYRTSVGVVTQQFPIYSCNTDNGYKSFKYGFMHDATTIHGNSGGPIFDSQGKLIGLTTLICYVDTVDGDASAGLGFSIANSSRVIIEKMQELGYLS